jgi:hypothetical protein
VSTYWKRETERTRAEAAHLMAELEVCARARSEAEKLSERLRYALAELVIAVTFGPESDLPNGAGRGYEARVPLGFVMLSRAALAESPSITTEAGPQRSRDERTMST